MPSLSHMTWIWPDLVILPHTAPHRRTPPPVTCLVQSGCVIHIPHYLIDYVPHRDMSLAHISPHAPTPPKCEDHFPSLEIDDTTAPKQQNHPFKTAVNKIGVFRRYTHTIMVPKKWGESRSCMWLTDNRYPAPVNREAIHEISHSMYKPFKPFPNFSTAMYMVAYFSGISKAHATSLVKIMQHPKFQWEELKNFNAHVENVQVDSYLKHRTHPFQTQNSWQEATVYICLPVENRIFSSEGNTCCPYMASTIAITDIIRSVCMSTPTVSFHFTPFSIHWIPNSDKPYEHEHMTNAYMSDTMIQAQTDVDSIPCAEGDTKEWVVLGLMLALNSTQLTSFGSASVWPI